MATLELHGKDYEPVVEIYCYGLDVERNTFGEDRVVAHCLSLPFIGETEIPKIKKVVFNDPATIVLWNDNTKTVVKCMEGDTYSKEMGFAMCICKKALGNSYHRVFKEWITYEPE